MALNKLVDGTQLDTDLGSVADAIRAKSGGSRQLAFPAGFLSEIGNIQTGGITPSGSLSIIENGTYDVTQKASAVVNVPQGITPTGTKQISILQNGTTTEDVTSYASAEITVNVPNSYAAGDEGKVVSNGALVAQTSDAVTVNGTVDTTLINSLTVNVPSGGGVVLVTGTLTFAARTAFNGYSLDVGIDCDFFALYATESPLQSNGRTYCGMFHDFTATTALNTINCTSNSGGSAYSGTLNAGVNISKSGTILNFRTTDSSNFQAGITYQWYAWGVTA